MKNVCEAGFSKQLARFQCHECRHAEEAHHVQVGAGQQAGSRRGPESRHSAPSCSQPCLSSLASTSDSLSLQQKIQTSVLGLSVETHIHLVSFLFLLSSFSPGTTALTFVLEPKKGLGDVGFKAYSKLL